MLSQHLKADKNDEEQKISKKKLFKISDATSLGLFQPVAQDLINVIYSCINSTVDKRNLSETCKFFYNIVSADKDFKPIYIELPENASLSEILIALLKRRSINQPYLTTFKNAIEQLQLDLQNEQVKAQEIRTEILQNQASRSELLKNETFYERIIPMLKRFYSVLINPGAKDTQEKLNSLKYYENDCKKSSGFSKLSKFYKSLPELITKAANEIAKQHYLTAIKKKNDQPSPKRL